MAAEYGHPRISYITVGDESSVPSVTSDVEPSVTCSNFLWLTQSMNDSNSNNLLKIFQVGGGRDPSCVVNGRYEGSITIESMLTLSQASSWKYLLGSETDGTVTATNSLPAFAVEVGYKDYNGDLKRVKFHYCKVNSFSLKFGKEGDPVGISLDIQYQRFWINDTLQTPTVPTSCPLVGYEGSLEIPSGTAIGGLQSLTLDVAHNLSKIESSDSRFLEGMVENERAYDLNFTTYFSATEGIANLIDFMGDSSAPTRSSTPTSNSMKISLTRGSDSIVLTFPASSTYFNTVSQPLDIGGDLVTQDVTGFATSITNIVITSS